MKRSDYINYLKNHLSFLSDDEIKDILDDVNEHLILVLKKEKLRKKYLLY